jgi:phage gp16-like protein
MNSAKATKRRRAIAKLHCARRDLGLDDGTYRALIARLANGKRPAAALDDRELGAVLDEVRRLGFRSPKTSDPDQRPSAPQERLAIALWRATWASWACSTIRAMADCGS